MEKDLLVKIRQNIKQLIMKSYAVSSIAEANPCKKKQAGYLSE